MLAEWLETLDDDAREYFEERAAILEFDGGLPKSEAELVARELTLAFLARRQNQI
jgi:hypothetical protein